MSVAQFRTVVSGDFASKGLAAAFIVALVRWLPPAQLAEYVFVSALVVLGATTFNGFFNRHYIVSNADEGAARMYRRWQVMSSALVFALAAILLAPERAPETLVAGLCCAAAAAAFDFARTHAQKIGRFGRYAASELLRSGVFLALAIPILMLAGRHTVPALLAAQAGCYLVAARLLPALPPLGCGQLRARALLADPTAASLVAYFALLGLFGQLPMLILERTGSEVELAAFGSAVRYYGLALGVVVATNVVLLPKLAAAHNAAELLTLLRQTRPMVVGALALLGVVALAGYLVIPYIDGGKYPDAPSLFLILCSALAPGIVMAPLTNTFLRLRLFFHLVASLLLANTACAAVATLGPQLSSFDAPTWAAISLPVAVGTTLIYLLIAFRRQRLAL